MAPTRRVSTPPGPSSSTSNWPGLAVDLLGPGRRVDLDLRIGFHRGDRARRCRWHGWCRRAGSPARRPSCRPCSRRACPPPRPAPRVAHAGGRLRGLQAGQAAAHDQHGAVDFLAQRHGGCRRSWPWPRPCAAGPRPASGCLPRRGAGDQATCSRRQTRSTWTLVGSKRNSSILARWEQAAITTPSTSPSSMALWMVATPSGEHRYSWVW